MANSYVYIKSLLGQNIRKYRDKAELTQLQLGLKIGITEHYIYQLEKGLRTPSIKVLCSISDILKIEPSQLFNEE